MKFPQSVSALTLVLLTALIDVTAATESVEVYKTKKDQVVLTGLKAKQKYDMQYRNAQGKNGQRQVKTNACGEALMSKASKFQSITINGRSIEPSALSLKEHRKCSLRRTTSNKRTVTTIQPTAFPTNPTSGSPK
jgi:hypothetical protein